MILALNSDPHTITQPAREPIDEDLNNKRKSSNTNVDLGSEIVTEVVEGEETPQ